VKIADQYVEDISVQELTATRRSFESDGFAEVWWSSESYGEGLHVSWYGSRVVCTCETAGVCARCQPQREAGRYVG